MESSECSELSDKACGLTHGESLTQGNHPTDVDKKIRSSVSFQGQTEALIGSDVRQQSESWTHGPDLDLSMREDQRLQQITTQKAAVSSSAASDELLLITPQSQDPQNVEQCQISAGDLQTGNLFQRTAKPADSGSNEDLSECTGSPDVDSFSQDGRPCGNISEAHDLSLIHI